jgi:hypothetical protein
MMKVPKILYKAQRQYRHNTGEGELVSGFDFEETIKIVKTLLERSDNSDYEATLKLPSLDDVWQGVDDGSVEFECVKDIYETIKKLANFS